MSIYLAALIGLIVVLAVGAIFYGGLFKANLKANMVPLTPTRFVIAGIGMYVISLVFCVFYNHLYFASGVTGVMKGIYLGILGSLAFLIIPIYADSPYLKANQSITWVILGNWFVSFIVLGAVTGLLLK